MNEPSPDDSLGTWLTYWLYLKRMSPAELSRTIGKSKNYLSQLINDVPHHKTGKPQHPSVETANLLGEALDVPPELILRRAKMLKGEEPAEGFTVRRISAIVQGFSSEKQRVVLEFVESLRKMNGESGGGSQHILGQTTPPHRAASKKSNGGRKSSAPPSKRRVAG